MKKAFLRLAGAGFILWHARHMVYHILLGLAWAWFLRERWGAFRPQWVWTAVVGSVLPDIDHFFYFFFHGRNDAYTKQIRAFFHTRQWRNLTVFIESGHKQNTSLSTHNVFIMGIFLSFSLMASVVDWEAGVILFGAILGHYVFDIADDMMTLGYVNPNWKRWGKPKVR